MKKYALIISIFLFITLFFISCGSSKKATNYGMNVTQVQIERYDTISSQVLNRLIIENAMPKLEDWQTANLTNYEENENYTFYFYYDQLNEKMLSLKRLISNKDTSYIYIIKNIKF